MSDLAEKKWDARLQRTHGINARQYRALWEEQGGKCPICLRPISGEFKTRAEAAELETRTHVDHDHTTDEVRGLLCGTCNQMIGLAYEEAARLMRAIDYLVTPTAHITPARSSGVPNAAKTRCPRDHEYTEENTFRGSGGQRRCRACRLAADRARRGVCADCGGDKSRAGDRCRSCAATARWAAARG